MSSESFEKKYPHQDFVDFGGDYDGQTDDGGWILSFKIVPEERED